MAGPGKRRFRHEAAVYGSDDELLDVAVPFLREGAAAGDATVLAVGEHPRRLILDALGDASGVTTTASEDIYASPVAAADRVHRMLHDLLGNGASRVRVLGEVPPHGIDADWAGWAGYEAAINHLYGPLDVWSVCPYDARTTPPGVLADVERTHTHLAGGDDGNPAYMDPATFLADRARRDADPLEATAPHAAQRDPTPAEARRLVAALARSTGLGAAEVERLQLAVSEVVTNATVHGHAPVDVRAWAAADRLVVTVRDHGPGPADPFVGFLPARGRPGGLGLWMANQACRRVALLPGPDGFTVRLTAGAGPEPPGRPPG